MVVSITARGNSENETRQVQALILLLQDLDTLYRITGSGSGSRKIQDLDTLYSLYSVLTTSSFISIFIKISSASPNAINNCLHNLTEQPQELLRHRKFEIVFRDYGHR